MLMAHSVQAEDLSGLQMPLFDVMHGMKTEWVAEKMIYNGHPMTIQNFSANRNAEDVMRHFASRWKVKGHGELKHRRVGDDMVIGYEHNGYSYSVQARDVPGGSEGSLVVTRIKEYEQGPVKFPIRPDAHLVSRIHSIDMGARSETLTLSSFQSASMNKHWYNATLSRDGWIGQETLPSSDGRVIAFQKGKAQCQLTFIDKSLVRNHRSMVMIHWIKG
jgi:hypothetical protein